MSRMLAVRWTVGAVSDAGLEALGWSIAGASQLFGASAEYIVCVNSISLDEAQSRAGPLPVDVRWWPASADEMPVFLRERLDDTFAEGVAWKFAPPRVAEGCHELALDNDCILWKLPDAIRLWLQAGDGAYVLAEDVRPAFGQFARFCGDEPRNTGIRGLSAGFSLVESLRAILDAHPVALTSELDEQGLQIAALRRSGPPLVVTTSEVTICSPFAPHQAHVGSCGAHFVGLNARALPWSCDGRPASALIREHWERQKELVRARITR
jgi:hypothetical protein